MEKIDLLKRDPPAKYIQKTLQIFTDKRLYEKGCIVEIGCMRGQLSHPLEEDHHFCCLDGHSTRHFALSGYEFYSCDISPEHCEIARADLLKIETSHKASVICDDGIKFLKEFTKPISLLFLDAWDVSLPESNDKHLEALEAALPHMTSESLILIDDTDVNYDFEKKYFTTTNGMGGKGFHVIPTAQIKGYGILFMGRQTLLNRSL